MKFLVVGHLCFDVIHPVEGPEIESYGGIYYALAALASLMDEGDTVVPVFGVNTADYEPLIANLGQFPHVDTSGIYKVEAPTNRVHLYYHDATQRTECSRDIVPPIPYEKIRRHLSVDGILVNMISGFDIQIETLDHIRMAIRERGIPIHFDFHSLTLGIDEKFERFRRPLENWRRWAFMTDTVQLNEEEVQGLTAERLSEEKTVGHLLTLSVKGVVVTRAERGATIFHSEHKRILRDDIPGIPVNGAQESTGCGDVFGAAFLLHYVKTKDMRDAARFANRAAATKAGMIGADGMRTLKANLVMV